MAKREPVEREVHKVPAGFTIEYSDGNHWYWVDGVHVPSVTTILRETIPVDLKWWAEKITTGGMIALAEMGIHPVTVAKALEALREYELSHEDVTKEAQDRGTAVHAAFEMYGRGEKVSLSDFPAKWRGYVRGLNKWMLSVDLEIVHQEIVVGSKKHQFAGRLDRLYRLNGELALLDLKTSAKIYESAHVQCGFYKWGCRDSGFEVPKRTGVLRVTEDGDFEFQESTQSAEFAARRVLKSFESVRRLKRELKEAA